MDLVKEFQPPASIEDARRTVLQLTVDITNIEGQLSAEHIRYNGVMIAKGTPIWREWRSRAINANSIKRQQVLVLKAWMHEQLNAVAGLNAGIESVLELWLASKTILTSGNTSTTITPDLLDRVQVYLRDQGYTNL